VPNGIMMPSWTPSTEGAGFAFTPILKPLEPFRDQNRLNVATRQLLVLSGLNSKPPAGPTDGGGRLTRAPPPDS
jgi:hypothetical protein